MDAGYAQEISGKLRAIPTLNAASLRAVRREVSSRVASTPPEEVIRLARQIIDAAPPGAYPFACEVIRYHPTALSRMTEHDLLWMGSRMSGWGEVDAFAGLAGAAWRNGQVSDKTVHEWARSRSRWWRRAALVSTIPLNLRSDGGSGDADRTVAVCELLVDDRDDMVIKAMSWALRALSAWNAEEVGAFVARHQDRLASRVVREVRKKLRSGRKNGRRLGAGRKTSPTSRKDLS